MSKRDELYERAAKITVGGGSSGGRTNIMLKKPLYLDHVKGCRLYTVDNEEYMDFSTAYGATLFGNAHPRIRAAVERSLEKGFFTSYDSEVMVEFAERFHQLVPGAEKIRFCNSGTEATLGAIRVARGYTGKNLIIKMDGHFHGMHEMIWYGHGNFPPMDEYGEVATAMPDSNGFPAGVDKNVKVIRFNDIDALRHAFAKYRGDVAAVIMEPVCFNCGCYEARPEYLKAVRELCIEEKVLLIFDEVITGLRFRPGSAQEYYGVRPDLSTFAKAIGGGFQMALLCGKAEVMETLAPIGDVVMSGTYTGQFTAMSVGLECLKMAMEPDFYTKMEIIENQLYGGIAKLFAKYEIPGHIRGKGAQFGLYFGYEDEEIDYDLRESMKRYDVDLGQKFVKGAVDEYMFFPYLANGIPYPSHCGINSQFTKEDVEEALVRIDRVFQKLKNKEIAL